MHSSSDAGGEVGFWASHTPTLRYSIIPTTLLPSGGGAEEVVAELGLEEGGF